MLVVSSSCCHCHDYQYLLQTFFVYIILAADLDQEHEDWLPDDSLFDVKNRDEWKMTKRKNYSKDHQLQDLSQDDPFLPDLDGL